jgi:hypothetical protein
MCNNNDDDDEEEDTGNRWRDWSTNECFDSDDNSNDGDDDDDDDKDVVFLRRIID